MAAAVAAREDVAQVLKQHLRYHRVSLHEEEQLPAFLRAIIAQNSLEESFFLVDLGKIIQQYHLWCKRLPRVQPHYAVKCNPEPAVLQTLAALGCSFDCASQAEMQAVLSLPGVGPEHVVYANPCKLRAHLRYARSVGVRLMTFDSEQELHKVADLHPQAQLLLRIVTDDSASMCAFSAKFGAHLEDAHALLSAARDLHLDVVGVSFHVGSGCGDAEAYHKAVRDARHVFEIAESLGAPMSVVDVGGGFPGAEQEPNSESVSFEDTAYVLNRALDEFFPPSSGVRILSEPGRFFVAESHILACNIFCKKVKHSVVDRSSEIEIESASDGDSHDNPLVPCYSSSAELQGQETKDKKQHNVYYIDDGVYQSFNCIFFDHMNPVPLPLSMRFEDEGAGSADEGACCTFPSKVFGPTCDGIDVVAEHVELPDLHCGDWLFFRGMGAYTSAASSSFNGFQQRMVLYCNSLEDMVTAAPLCPEAGASTPLQGHKLHEGGGDERKLAPDLWSSSEDMGDLALSDS